MNLSTRLFWQNFHHPVKSATLVAIASVAAMPNSAEAFVMPIQVPIQNQLPSLRALHISKDFCNKVAVTGMDKYESEFNTSSNSDNSRNEAHQFSSKDTKTSSREIGAGGGFLAKFTGSFKKTNSQSSERQESSNIQQQAIQASTRSERESRETAKVLAINTLCDSVVAAQGQTNVAYLQTMGTMFNTREEQATLRAGIQNQADMHKETLKSQEKMALYPLLFQQQTYAAYPYMGYQTYPYQAFSYQAAPQRAHQYVPQIANSNYLPSPSPMGVFPQIQGEQ